MTSSKRYVWYNLKYSRCCSKKQIVLFKHRKSSYIFLQPCRDFRSSGIGQSLYVNMLLDQKSLCVRAREDLFVGLFVSLCAFVFLCMCEWACVCRYVYVCTRVSVHECRSSELQSSFSPRLVLSLFSLHSPTLSSLQVQQSKLRKERQRKRERERYLQLKVSTLMHTHANTYIYHSPPHPSLQVKQSRLQQILYRPP